MDSHNNNSNNTPVILPLKGVRVLELCNVAAGPFCGLLLADMGADVIKIENPSGGDTLRTWPPITATSARSRSI